MQLRGHPTPPGRVLRHESDTRERRLPRRRPKQSKKVHRVQRSKPNRRDKKNTNTAHRSAPSTRDDGRRPLPPRVHRGRTRLPPASVRPAQGQRPHGAVRALHVGHARQTGRRTALATVGRRQSTQRATTTAPQGPPRRPQQGRLPHTARVLHTWRARRRRQPGDSRARRRQDRRLDGQLQRTAPANSPSETSSEPQLSVVARVGRTIARV